MKLKYSLLALLATAVNLHSQVLFNGSYSQTFDTLPVNPTTTVTSWTFTNNSNLVGWYSSVGTGEKEARSSSGSATASGVLYSWGAAGASDRAFGTFGANGYSSTAYFGLQLLNDTDATISMVDVDYVVEQWRRNTNATSWTFQYLVTNATGDQISTSGYMTLSAGNVTAPQTGTAAGLNGNDPANQVSRSFTLSGLDWQAGEYLWLRWANDQGETSSGLGLDNFSIVAVPEPTTTALFLVSLVGLGSSAIRRRQK